MQPRGCKKGSKCDFSHERVGNNQVEKLPKLCQNSRMCSWKPRCRYIHPEDGKTLPERAPRVGGQDSPGFCIIQHLQASTRLHASTQEGDTASTGALATGSGAGETGAGGGKQQCSEGLGAHAQYVGVPKHASTQKCDNNLDEPVNKSKRKRERRKNCRNKMRSLKLFGNNVDGIVKKLEALENLIISENPAVIFFQETKTGRSGRIKTPSSKQYTWYKLHRTVNSEKGGGLSIGVLNVLEPSWISEEGQEAEALTIEIWVEGFPIRLLCGYGPQEYDNKDRKDKFWDYLSTEVNNANTCGAGIIVQMDGNLWAGSDIVPGDPKPQNQNDLFTPESKSQCVECIITL